MKRVSLLWLGAVMVFFQSCVKETKTFIPDNQPPDYGAISTLKIQNYVNRLYIDLLGREATDLEMDRDVLRLRNNKLSFASRDSLIYMLMKDSSYHEGDSSYRHAYVQRIYDLGKARFLEGAAEGDIWQQIGILNFSITVNRLNGDSIGVASATEQRDKYLKVINSRYEYRKGTIGIDEMYARMIDNGIYDLINMNSFNFVNASFDNLLLRNPSKTEFNEAYQVIEYNKPGYLFGRVASNRREYCFAITRSPEFYEAQIRYAYKTLVQREPTAQEIINLYAAFRNTLDYTYVQNRILRTDEYAQFN